MNVVPVCTTGRRSYLSMLLEPRDQFCILAGALEELHPIDMDVEGDHKAVVVWSYLPDGMFSAVILKDKITPKLLSYALGRLHHRFPLVTEHNEPKCFPKGNAWPVIPSHFGPNTSNVPLALSALCERPQRKSQPVMFDVSV